MDSNADVASHPLTQFDLIVLSLAALLLALLLLVRGRGFLYLRKFKEPKAAFDGAALVFERYPFEPATVYPSGVVHADDIQSIELGYPSEIRLKNGDILFIPNSSKMALMEFVNHHDIHPVKRLSVWASLLEPYLDSSQTKEEAENDLEWLAKRGIDKHAVGKWRHEVGGAMMALNFGAGLWEWVGFGLYDVLIAKRAFGRQSAFADFYRRALALASFDEPLQASFSSEWRDTLSGALHSVLLDWFPALGKGSLSTVTERWNERRHKIAALQSRLCDQLSAAYPQSRGLEHVENCLTVLWQNHERAVRLNEVRWALIFLHADVDPERAAAWACRVMAELGRPVDEREYVHALLMQEQPGSPDLVLIHDIERRAASINQPIGELKT